jgi:deazaflavin-dependent oxidoreductase (nitroreductase family)
VLRASTKPNRQVPIASALGRHRRSRCVGCDTFAPVPEGHAPFAVLNRTANPVVRVVLSSPLHPLLSRSLALITVTGRRSGRRYTVPVGYCQDGDRVLIRVGWPERKHWWRNLKDAGQVEMCIRGARRTGQASARGDERTGVTVEVKLHPRPAR